MVKPLGSPTTLDVGLHLGASASPVSCGLFHAGGRMDDVIRGAQCRVAGCPALPSTVHFPSVPLWPSARGSNCLHKDASSPSALPPTWSLGRATLNFAKPRPAQNLPRCPVLPTPVILPPRPQRFPTTSHSPRGTALVFPHPLSWCTQSLLPEGPSLFSPILSWVSPGPWFLCQVGRSGEVKGA